MQTIKETTIIPIELPYDCKGITEQINKPETQAYVSSQIRQQMYNNLFNNTTTNVSLKNPNERTEHLLEENNKELYSIHYEDMKTNAQLQTLLKVVDSQNDEMERLKSINQELKKVNNTLKENNKHSFRDGIIIGLIPFVLEWIIKIVIYLLQCLEVIPK